MACGWRKARELLIQMLFKEGSDNSIAISVRAVTKTILLDVCMFSLCVCVCVIITNNILFYDRWSNAKDSLRFIFAQSIVSEINYL